jgi:hypothetical protein
VVEGGMGDVNPLCECNERIKSESKRSEISATSVFEAIISTFELDEKGNNFAIEMMAGGRTLFYI